MRKMNRGRSPMMGRPQQSSPAQPVPNQGFGKTTAAQMLQAGATPQTPTFSPEHLARQTALQNATKGAASPTPNQGFGKITADQMLKAGATPQAAPNQMGLGLAGGKAPTPTGTGLAGMSPTRMSALQNVPQGAALKKGGSVKSSASKRGDGCAQRGKTKGRIV